MWAALIPSLLAIVGKLIPDPEQRAKAQLQLLELQRSGDLAELNAAVSIIVAEASGTWLQRSWRPLMMLFFAGLVGARWFGFSAPGMSEAEVLELWAIVKLGIGGYTIGRTVEKVAPSLAAAIRR